MRRELICEGALRHADARRGLRARSPNPQNFAALGGMVTIRREGNSLGGVERLASDELEGL